MFLIGWIVIPFNPAGQELFKCYLTSLHNRVAQCSLSMVCGQTVEVSASGNCYDLGVGDTTIVMHSDIKIKRIGKTHSGGEIRQGVSNSYVVLFQTFDNHKLP